LRMQKVIQGNVNILYQMLFMLLKTL